MVLAFTPRPIRHPFALPSPLVPTLPAQAKSLPHPTSRITRPSAELQPTCWIQGQLGFRCHNKNHSVPLMIVWLLGRRPYHPFFLSFRLSFFFFNQSFFISFALNCFVVLSFFPTPFAFSDVFGCWGKWFCTSVVWKVLRDMSSLSCLPAGAESVFTYLLHWCLSCQCSQIIKT